MQSESLTIWDLILHFMVHKRLNLGPFMHLGYSQTILCQLIGKGFHYQTLGLVFLGKTLQLSLVNPKCDDPLAPLHIGKGLSLSNSWSWFFRENVATFTCQP